MKREFAYPAVRWLLKGWFFGSAVLFFYLFMIDVFVHRWFILLWSIFSLGLGVYVAPAIRIGKDALAVKYLWKYRRIPWERVMRVERTLLGAQFLTVEPHWMYRVVGYQYPMPRVRELVAAARSAQRARRFAGESLDTSGGSA
ncbi:MAG TPA: hypothetical protein VFG78_09250 [Gemmatimonadota bacterium]|nr:hypothetical protein [Gemmatimonadota bacterium]